MAVGNGIGGRPGTRNANDVIKMAEAIAPIFSFAAVM